MSAATWDFVLMAGIIHARRLVVSGLLCDHSHIGSVLTATDALCRRIVSSRGVPQFGFLRLARLFRTKCDLERANSGSFGRRVLMVGSYWLCTNRNNWTALFPIRFPHFSELRSRCRRTCDRTLVETLPGNARVVGNPEVGNLQ